MFNKKIRFLSSLLLIITVFSSSTFNAQAAVSNFNDGITIGLGNTTLGTGLLLDVDGNIGANSFCDANGANCTAAAGIGGKWLDGVGANEIYYSAANVGIGISNPAAPLHLSNNSATLRIDDANDASATADTVIRMYDNASAQMSWLGRTNNILYFRNVNGDDIRMGTSNSDDLTIEPSGEVGIGTTTPVEELHVFTSQANPTTIIAGNTSTSTNTNTRAGFTAAANGGQLDIYHSGSAATGSVGDQTKADAAVIKTLTGSPSSKMVIGTGGAVPLNFMTNDLTRMTILANGNVGIGKTNPGTALDMTGQIRTTSHIEAGNGTGGVAMTVNDGYGNANLTFNHVSGVPDITGNAARIEVNTDSTTNAQMYFELGSGLTTGVAAGLTSVMRLGADGRVGIGTTAPSARLHIVSGADSNLLLSGGSKDLSVPNGEVLQIGHLDTTTNAFTERMQISTSGNVGIGDTTPDGTLRLDVEGRVGATEYCDANGNNCTLAAALGSGYWSKTGDDVWYNPGATGEVGIGLSNPTEELVVNRSANDAPTTIAVQNSNTGTGTNTRAGFAVQSNGAALDLMAYSSAATGSIGGTTKADSAFLRTSTTLAPANLNIGTGSAVPLNFFTGDVTRMTIGAGGNVGIGGDPGTRRFSVRTVDNQHFMSFADESPSIGVLRINSVAANENSQISLRNEAANLGVSLRHGIFGGLNQLQIGNDLNFTDVTFDLTNSRVGIGTTTPNQKLHVEGGDVRINSGGNGSLRFGASDQYLYGDGDTALYYNAENSTTTQMIFRDKQNTVYGRVYGSGKKMYTQAFWLITVKKCEF